MLAVTSYFATLGVKTDDKGLKAVDDYLKRIENKLKRGTSNNGLLLNVGINERFFRKSVAQAIEKSVFQVKISPVLNKSSLASLRQQIQSMFLNTPVSMNVRVSGAGRGGSGGGGNRGGGGKASSRSTNTPSFAAIVEGKPSKGGNSASVTRFFDSMMSEGIMFKGGTSSLSKTLYQGTAQGIGRYGASTAVGRGLGGLGNAVGGARLGALGLIGGAGLNALTDIARVSWSQFGKIATAPFQAISGAASLVTDSFYRIALAAAPAVAGFMYINRTVQQSQQRQIALNTVSKAVGSNGKDESSWLMNMANREGLRYNTLIDPFTTFIASASPAMGLPMAKNIFESFTQFGLTRGANDVSMQLAMKAVSQMSGKGKIQAEELRGQLGDAPGFGEMQGIFAEAYQMSLGRTGSQVLKGQKAIEELNKAMETGNVYSAKVLPYVAEIAKRLAEPGLAEARGASFAEQARFANQTSRGWTNFRQGGGEDGLSYFWRMMQQMGTWFESNGAKLGGYFQSFTGWLNVARVGIKEFVEFAITGDLNDLTTLAQNWGINLPVIREELMGIFEGVLNIFKENSDESLGEVIKNKITNFSNSLILVLRSVKEMLAGLNIFFEGLNEFRDLPWWQKVTVMSAPSQLKMAKGLGIAAYHGISGTSEVTGAVIDAYTKSTPNEIATRYQATGNGRGGFGSVPSLISPQAMSASQMYTPAMQQVYGHNLSGNLKVEIEVTGNSAIASQLDTPETNMMLREEVKRGIQYMFKSEMSNASKF